MYICTYVYIYRQYLGNTEYYTNPYVIVIIIATIVTFLVTTLCQVIRLKNFPFIVSFLVFIHKQVLQLCETVFLHCCDDNFFLLSFKMVSAFSISFYVIPHLDHSGINSAGHNLCFLYVDRFNFLIFYLEFLHYRSNVLYTVFFLPTIIAR